MALLGIAAPARADVAVTPAEAVQGDGADLTFRIANDSPSASITAIDVQLPGETPIAEVYPLSVDDWAPSMTNVKIDKPVASLHGYQITEVTTGVKWVAMEGRALPPGGRTELYLSIGPLPAVDRLAFAVTLFNSDGTQTKWNGPLVLKAGAGHAEHGAAAPVANDAAPPPAPSSGGTNYLTWSLVALLFIAAICIVSVVLQNRRPVVGEKPAA
ncbi:DUF1775 domain-containing protein [Dactylosporangium sp. CS-033363]|uniref:DUF1775 domain-containing protein n=1 Tax=Dactylosporangium sp. CS-033363 TaxID=3239935 RepID=UPI003D94C84A